MISKTIALSQNHDAGAESLTLFFGAERKKEINTSPIYFGACAHGGELKERWRLGASQ